MQFRAKQAHYRSAFPNAVTRIILVAGSPVGFLTTNAEVSGLHIVDIAFLKEFRGRGIGSAVLGQVLCQASGPVTLVVDIENPARRLYERLGFQEISRTETDAFLRRDPQSGDGDN